jgi:cytochrome c
MSRLTTRVSLMGAAFILATGLLSPQAASAGDAGKGRGVFNSQCAMCHSNARNGPTILGPTLFGVVGRSAGSVAGFAYSSGMKSSGITWSNDKLEAYLPAPRAMVPGTKMSFGGIKNPTQLGDLVAYLDTLK